MTQLLEAPRFILHRTIALNPLVPDVNDPANPPPTNGIEAAGFEYGVIYWDASAGVAADGETMTFRIIGFDYQQQVWTRIRTVTLRLKERVIVPLLGQAIFVRVDAEATAATQAQIFISGFTPEGSIAEDPGYVTLPEQAVGFLPGGAAGIADTGFVFTREVAGVTELFYQDNNGVITQLTGAGASGLQAAYDIDPSIVTTTADGAIDFTKGPTSLVGERLLDMHDVNIPAARTVSLARIDDQNDVAAGGVASLEIVKSNSTNSGVNLLLSGADVGAQGPIMEMFHDSASPAVSDIIARTIISGRDGGAAKQSYGEDRWTILDPTAASEDGDRELFLVTGGTLGRALEMRGASAQAEQGVIFRSQRPTADNSPPFLFRHSINNPTSFNRIIFQVEENDGAAAADIRLQLTSEARLKIRGEAGATSVGLRVEDSAVATLFGVERNNNFASFFNQTLSGIQLENLVAPSATPGVDVRNGLGSAGTGQIIFAISRNTVPDRVLTIDGVGLEVLRSFDAGALGAVLQLDHQSASPAANDVAGRVQFSGRDSGAAVQEYLRLDGVILDATAGTEDGEFQLFATTGGTSGVIAHLRGANTSTTPGLVIENNVDAGSAPAFNFLATKGIGAGQTLALFETNNGTDVFTIDGDGDTTITSVSAGALGPELVLFQDSASPAAADVVMRITGRGRDSGGNVQEYGHTQWVIVDATSTSEDGEYVIAPLIAATSRDVLLIRGDQERLITHTGGPAGAHRFEITGSVATTDATPTAIPEFTFTLADNTTYSLVASIAVFVDDAGATADQGVYFIRQGVFREAAGGATLLGAIAKDAFETSAGLDVNFAVTGNNLEVRVTGLGSRNARWTGWFRRQLAAAA